MTQPHHDDNLNYDLHVDDLLKINAELLGSCKTLAEDCRMALSGEWDKGDEGFQASLELLESVITKATGGANA